MLMVGKGRAGEDGGWLGNGIEFGTISGSTDAARFVDSGCGGIFQY